MKIVLTSNAIGILFYYDLVFRTLKKKTLWSIFIMDGVQLPQGYSHFEEAVYFLHILLVLNALPADFPFLSS